AAVAHRGVRRLPGPAGGCSGGAARAPPARAGGGRRSLVDPSRGPGPARGGGRSGPRTDRLRGRARARAPGVSPGARGGPRGVGAAGGVTWGRELHPAAITLALGLPDIDGGRVLTCLKTDLATRHTPVQVISVEQEPDEPLRRGARAVLAKPATVSTLDAALL